MVSAVASAERAQALEIPKGHQLHVEAGGGGRPIDGSHPRCDLHEVGIRNCPFAERNVRFGGQAGLQFGRVAPPPVQLQLVEILLGQRGGQTVIAAAEFERRQAGCRLEVGGRPRLVDDFGDHEANARRHRADDVPVDHLTDPNQDHQRQDRGEDDRQPFKEELRRRCFFGWGSRLFDRLA